MECNSISYQFTLESTPLGKAEMCPYARLAEWTHDNLLMKEFYIKKTPPQFVRDLKLLKNNISSDAQEYCKKNLDYRAEVIFKMATDTLPVTVLSSRLSFFEKMSAFGKKTHFF